MQSADRQVERRYRFGPRNQRGLLAGIRWEQATVVAVSMVCSVVLVRSSASSSRFYEAFGVVATSLVFSFWPVRGRTTQQWLPTVASFVGASLGKRRTEVFRGGEQWRRRSRSKSLVDAVVHCVETPRG